MKKYIVYNHVHMKNVGAWKYAFAFILALIFGSILYNRSSMPPYGYPINELSNNYWGVIVDIAHRWRTFDFTVWTRSLGGGYDLFSSGQYPILNPTNALAWVLSDDVFYLVKLIEPYVLGFFFMMVLVWDVFKTRWYVAVFGGLAYMGLLFGKQMTIAESPYFLMGVALFPAMVLAFLKWRDKSPVWAAAAVGGLVGFQFLSEGVTQLPQLILWWLLFFLVCRLPKVKASAAFITAFFVVSAVQLLPTLQFFLHESARTAGQYGVNNYPLWGNGVNSVGFHCVNLLTGTDPLREKTSVVLILACAAAGILGMGKAQLSAPYVNFLRAMWIATALYFAMPTAFGIISDLAPFTQKAFTWMSFFSIRYGLHILDFCLVLTMCLIIHEDNFVFKKSAGLNWRLIPAFLLFLCGLVLSFIPITLFYFPNIADAMPSLPWLAHYVPPKIKAGLNFLFTGLACLIGIVLRPGGLIRHAVMIYFLLGMSFMFFLDSFKWYDKGCRVQEEAFQLDSPERHYYEKAKGKYLLPFITAHYPQIQSNAEPAWTAHNYNLLYGVAGTSGFMALAPRRLIQFQAHFNNRLNNSEIKLKSGGAFFLNIYEPTPAAFASYFPADFTMIRKDQPLPWPGFKKVVSGEKYDVYEREKPTERVYFADRLAILPLKELVKEFERPRSKTVFVEEADARSYTLPQGGFESKTARYHDFKQPNDGQLSFTAVSDAPTIIVVPERFQRGWNVLIDGNSVDIFPAYYLFIGFAMPAGSHRIELKYNPFNS